MHEKLGAGDPPLGLQARYDNPSEKPPPGPDYYHDEFGNSAATSPNVESLTKNLTPFRDPFPWELVPKT